MAKRARQMSLFAADDEPADPHQDDCKQAQPPPAEQGPQEPPTDCDEEPAGPPESLHGKTVYVVDAHSLIYQVFHALPDMTSPEGEPVGAVYGFARDIFYLLQTKKPDYLFCAFDMPGKTFRHDLYDQYKIQRSAMPDDLIPQIAMIRSLLEALGVPVLGVESFEADDILATLARAVDELQGDCFLVTNDKDCRQMIGPRVGLYNIRKDQVFGADELQAAWGVRPDQVVDFQALVGDSVDNVPGVPLIGPKIAGELIQKYGTLEEVLDHANEVSGAKRKQNLLEHADLALMSRVLVRLDQNVPVEIDWNAARPGRVDRDRALELFRRFGFRSMAEKLDVLEGKAPEPKPQRNVECRVVDTPKALEELVLELGRQTCLSVDLETVHIDPENNKVWPRWAKIVGFSFAWADEKACYVPVRAPEGEKCLDPESTIEALRPVLENPSIGKVGQNLKYDHIVLRGYGVRLSPIVFDTMVASYLLEAGRRNHNLDELARRYLDHTTIKISELIGSGKNQKRMDQVPVRQVADYAGEDALLPLVLKPMLAERLASEGLDKLFTELELPLIDVLAELEFNGITVDVARLEELSHRYGQRIEAAEREIYKAAGHTLNIASPKQLQKVLFDELGLPVIKKTKTGPSTDVEVLEELAELHPLPAKIVEYRQYTKLQGTYVDALPKMVHPETGRVHASFHQAVAATGRLSSSDPNLQNIPVRTEEGREIRSAFVPAPKDWRLLAADYSQIELRVLAHFSGDQRLREAFENDEDIHARVASQVYSVPLDEVTREMRRKAKAVNFGVIYGQSPFGLAKQLRIEQDEAAEFIDSYFEGYPSIEGFLGRVLEECSENGYVSTILGRKRSIRGVRPNHGRSKNLAERTAINTVIQGSAADLIKQAMIAIHRRLAREKLPAAMLLQIHDELIFEVHAEQLDYLAQAVVDEMVGAQVLDVPLKVDVKTGPNWADTKPWKPPEEC